MSKHTCGDCAVCNEEEKSWVADLNTDFEFRDEFIYGPFYQFEPKIDFVDILQGYMDGHLSLSDLNDYVNIINDEIEANSALMESAIEQRAELQGYDESQEIDLGGC